MALSIDSDCEPLACVKVLSSTLEMFSRAITPACRAVLCAIGYVGFSLTRFTKSCASSILKTAVQSASFLCTYISRFAVVNFMCILTPWSECVGMLHISVCKRPTNSITLLCFNLSQLATYPVFVVEVLAAVGSHTPRWPVSRYQNAFVSCDSAVSLP